MKSHSRKPSVGRLNIPKSTKTALSSTKNGPKSPIEGPRSTDKPDSDMEYFSFPKKVASRSTSQHSNLSILAAYHLSPDVTQTRLPKLPAASTSSYGAKAKQVTNTEPAEMLSKLRQSLNLKTKSTSAVETALKNQQAIDGVRESIEQKRISTNLGLLMLPPLLTETAAEERQADEFISPQSSIGGSTRMVYDKEAFNNSYLSLGLAFLDSSAPVVAPAIFVNNEKKHLMKLGSRENVGLESEGRTEGKKELENSDKEPEILAPGMESQASSSGAGFNGNSGLEDPGNPSSESQTWLVSNYESHALPVSLAELPKTPIDTRHGHSFRDDADRVVSGGSFDCERRNLVGDKERLRRTNSSNTEDIAATLSTDIEDNYRNGLNDDYFKSPHEIMPPSKMRNISPIAIPPSLNASAREPGYGSSESLGLIAAPRISGAQYQLGDNLSKTDKKPKRKPPPEMVHSASSAYTNDTEENDHLSDSSSAKRLSQMTLDDKDDEYYYYSETLSETEGSSANPKFPQFSSFSERPKFEKTHSLFKKRTKKAVGGLLELEVELDNEMSDAAFSRSQASLPLPRSGTPVVQKQPVQLKTTMRKTNKRKEKKTAFNEIKPWKNHSDLLYVTEQERKRYEGLWVSNKGNYMALVVTRLVGVDYDSQSPSEISEIKASTQAAQLSSKSTQNASDIDRLHELSSADVHNLAHGVVVKRIWGRSRLPNETLQAIWELVDFRKDGSLSKAEFIVGMWLIDQTLYGRKLPKKVEDSVWESLGSIGVNVVIKKKRR